MAIFGLIVLPSGFYLFGLLVPAFRPCLGHNCILCRFNHIFNNYSFLCLLSPSFGHTCLVFWKLSNCWLLAMLVVQHNLESRLCVRYSDHLLKCYLLFSCNLNSKQLLGIWIRRGQVSLLLRCFRYSDSHCILYSTFIFFRSCKCQDMYAFPSNCAILSVGFLLIE